MRPYSHAAVQPCSRTGRELSGHRTCLIGCECEVERQRRIRLGRQTVHLLLTQLLVPLHQDRADGCLTFGTDHAKNLDCCVWYRHIGLAVKAYWVPDQTVVTQTVQITAVNNAIAKSSHVFARACVCTQAYACVCTQACACVCTQARACMFSAEHECHHLH